MLLALTEKGITREDAYKIVQDNAMKCWETGTDLKTLVLADPRVTKKLKKTDLDAAFDLGRHFRDVGRTFRLLRLA